jgi:hypothetical protein
MLHHLFKYVDELLSIDGVIYSSYEEVFIACYEHHSHNKDYYIDPEPDADGLPNDNNNIISRLSLILRSKPSLQTSKLMSDIGQIMIWSN